MNKIGCKKQPKFHANYGHRSKFRVMSVSCRNRFSDWGTGCKTECLSHNLRSFHFTFRHYVRSVPVRFFLPDITCTPVLLLQAARPAVLHTEQYATEQTEDPQAIFLSHISEHSFHLLSFCRLLQDKICCLNMKKHLQMQVFL